MAVVYSQPGKSDVPIGVWFVLLSPFLFDSGMTLARRLLRGEPVWQAHRSHFYQRLVGVGWSHARVAALYLTLAGVMAALAGVHFGLQRLSVLALGGVALLAFAAIVLLVWRIEFSTEQLTARGKSVALRAAHWQFIRRAGIYLLADAVIVALAYYLALPVRFAGGVPPQYYNAWRDGLWIIVRVLAPSPRSVSRQTAVPNGAARTQR